MPDPDRTPPNAPPPVTPPARVQPVLPQAPQTDAYLNRILNRLKNSGVQFKISPNILNKYDRYAYHLRLSMVNDVDANDPYIRDKIINNKIRKAIIAESGVTVGFNITECEIKDAVSSNFRTRNAATTEISMTITEPYSMSLPDKMFLAGQQLGTYNWRIIPLFLELEFKAYDADGKIVNDTTDKIHKVYKLNIVEFSSSLTQSGSIYKIIAAVDNSLGFKDIFYIIPQTYTVKLNGPPTPLLQNGILTGTLPGTVGAFFTELGNSITKFYRELRKAGGTPDPNSLLIGNPPQLLVYNFRIAPVLADKELNFTPLQNSRRLSFTLSNGGAEITIGRGISIGSIIDDVLSSLKDTNFFKLNDSEPGGRIRIPKVECRVNNIGYDTILNDYIREITYFITVKESTRPVPSVEFGRAFQLDSDNANNRLKWLAEHSIKKAYMYYYTGNNTEIVHLDTNFNQLHIIPLPIGKPTVAVPAIGSSVNNPANAFAQAQTRLSQLRTEQLRLQTQIVALQAQRGIATLVPGSPDAQLNETIRDLEALERRNEAEITRVQNFARTLSSQGLVFFDPTVLSDTRLTGVREDPAFANDIRSRLAAARQINDQRSGTRLFVETLKVNQPTNKITENPPDFLTYIADPRDIVQMVRPGNSASFDTDKTKEARQLYSTVTAQLYDNQGQMTQIEMDIRGDPYWLGPDNLERTEEFESWYPRLSTTTGQPSPGSVTPNERMGASNTRLQNNNFANYNDFDATFVLIFRTGISPDEKTGYMDLQSNVEFFSAVYQCIEVTHIFKDGKFLQKITATKDNLTNLNANVQVNSNHTQPPSFAPGILPTDRSGRRDQG